MADGVRWLVLCILFISVYVNIASVPHRKFEYKYSFKPPYLAQKDGSVPFWTYGGNAIASSESVRLAPSMKSQKGAMWTKSKTVYDWWEVDILFRISGRGRIGADGLAFWYTENQGSYDGEVFGSSDKWKGLGVFFDSFDNDNQRNNPYIMAVVNDGTKAFDHQKDGTSQALRGCLRDFRNKPYPTRVKIEYYLNTITVLYQNGMSNKDHQDFEVCLRAENVHLPKNGFFGISAATGSLADDHDVIHFLSTSLYPPGQLPSAPGTHNKFSPEEESKLSEEYAEYQRKLEHQKEEYRKEHPSAGGKDPESEFEEWYESDSQRELRQIFTGQNQILDQVKHLSTKLDEIVGRQERQLSLLSSIHHGGSQQLPPGQGVPPGSVQPLPVDSIRRHEVETILSNQNTLISAAHDLRSFINDISSRTESILKNIQSGRGQVQGGNYDSFGTNELKEILKGLKMDVEVTAQRVATQPVCTSSWVPPIILVLVALAQLLIMFLYMLYRDSKGQQYKKFY